jgi:hypothetical protein
MELMASEPTSGAPRLPPLRELLYIVVLLVSLGISWGIQAGRLSALELRLQEQESRPLVPGEVSVDLRNIRERLTGIETELRLWRQSR